tara:strand:- start:12 stop:194 length:183 start_codon:yes stop_codon:yes gene_type:complete
LIVKIRKKKETGENQPLTTLVVENQQTTTLLFFYYAAGVENKISIGSHDPAIPTVTTLTL